jgi:hypothetical protein
MTSTAIVFYDRVAELQADTLLIRDLRFTFSVERSLRGSANKAEIHIFNLNADHRDALAALGSVPCRLSCGYDGALHTLFAGDMRNVQSVHTPNTWDTKIDGLDGGTALRLGRTHRSYRPGVQLETIYGDLAADLGLGRGNLDAVASQLRLSGAGSELVRGSVFSGSASADLEALARSCELEVSVQNGTLQILPLGGALEGDPIVLEAGGGLVGDVAKDKKGAITFKTLLRPDLFPGRKVQPNTRSVRGGDYRVTKCKYTGDTHGQDWYVEGTATPVRRG